MEVIAYRTLQLTNTNRMHTTITSLGFQQKIKGKYDSDYIELMIEKISLEPRIGKKFIAVNNIFKFDLF